MVKNATSDTMMRYTIVAMALIRTADIVNRYLELQLRQTKESVPIQSPIQFAVLNALCLRNGRKTPTVLSKWMFRSPHTITSMLDTLEKSQLVRRAHDKNDRRSINIVVTKKGQASNRKVAPVAEELSQKLFSCLDEQQIEVLQGILRRIRKYLLAQIGNASAPSRSRPQ